jgi:hypothetical protein
MSTSIGGSESDDLKVEAACYESATISHAKCRANRSVDGTNAPLADVAGDPLEDSSFEGGLTGSMSS